MRPRDGDEDEQWEPVCKGLGLAETGNLSSVGQSEDLVDAGNTGEGVGVWPSQNVPANLTKEDVL